MWEYTDKVLEYFRNPKNMGEIEDPDGIGEVGSLDCGDVMRLTLKIEPETEKILDAKFKTFGCASAIASASILTELIIGKTVDEALKVTDKQIIEELGGLPCAKIHCSVMGYDALVAAINNYRGIDKKEGNVICKCFNVTDKHIEEVVREHNLHTIEEITNYTKAGGGCGKCHPEIQEILDRIWE